MPIKKLRISCKSEGARGNEQALEMVDLMCDNWDSIMEAFGNKYKSEDEKLDLVVHLNSKVEELGE